MTPPSPAPLGLYARWSRYAGSLRTQLIFWNVFALTLLLIGLGIVCYFITHSFILNSIDREMEASIRMFQRHPRFSRTPPRQSLLDTPAQFLMPHPMHATGDPYAPSMFSLDGKAENGGINQKIFSKQAFDRAAHGETVFVTLMIDEEPVRVLYAPGLDHQDRRGVAQRAYPLKEVDRITDGLNTALLVLVPIGLLGAGWVGVVLTNRVLRRMQIMAQAAERLGAGDFTQRLPVSGHDEFSDLAKTFNGLLGRLDGAFQKQMQIVERQRRFTADASHELKTPLTIIKGRASLGGEREATDEKSRRTFREIEAATDTMSHLVQDLLLLARADEGRMGDERVEMLVEEVLQRAISAAAQEGSAEISREIVPANLSVYGNEAELVRLFRNLFDNAVCYTPAQGSIRVTAFALDDLESSVLFTVQDTGAGIAPEHLPHCGERFYRADASRTRPTGGTGLGLSICKSIAQAHGGTLTLESSLGVGTTVTVVLPGHPQT